MEEWERYFKKLRGVEKKEGLKGLKKRRVR